MFLNKGMLGLLIVKYKIIPLFCLSFWMVKNLSPERPFMGIEIFSGISCSVSTSFMWALSWVLLGSLRSNNCKFKFVNLFRHYLSLCNFWKLAGLLGNWFNRCGVKARKENSNSRLCVHVLFITWEMVISRHKFSENGKEMYSNNKSTWRAWKGFACVH